MTAKSAPTKSGSSRSQSKSAKDSIVVQNVRKSFIVDTGKVEVLRDISFSIKSGEFVVIIGPSGCGKSTLLHSILGLEPPTTGKVVVLDKNLYAEGVEEDDRGRFRKTRVGMIYQQPQWVKALSVLENVALPQRLNGLDETPSLTQARKLLAQVGMNDWENYFPTQLSSGQQQKVALARALVTDPTLIIADEPTGNLDFESGQELMQLLGSLSGSGKTIVMVTHDLDYLQYADRVIKLFDGRVQDDDYQASKREVAANGKKHSGDGSGKGGDSGKANSIEPESMRISTESLDD